MKVAIVVLLASTPAFADEGAGKPPSPAVDAAAKTSPAIAAAPAATTPSAATADQVAAVAPSRDHAVSVQLATLDTSGIGIQAERDLHWHKLSIALGVGIRGAAQGDYDSSTIGFGVELRRWLRRPVAMRGLYVGVRTDLARTSITDTMEDRAIGTLTTWAVGATLGYRIVIRDRIEFTPSAGVAWVVEGGTAPTTVRRAGLAGITFGYLF